MWLSGKILNKIGELKLLPTLAEVKFSSKFKYSLKNYKAFAFYIHATDFKGGFF